MLRFIAAHLRGRLGRTVALVCGVMVATTGFTVLTANTTTARLGVVGTVNANYRAAYDILVRPAGSRSGPEAQRGLVRSNFLSGQYGGISLAQWRQLLQVPGVDVAAPIAMLGYAMTQIPIEVDLTGAVDPAATRQVLRVKPTWYADRGLTRLDDDQPMYVYVTSRPVAWPLFDQSGATMPSSDTWPYSDGVARPLGAAKAACGMEIPVTYEQREDGTWRPLCASVGQFSDADAGAEPGAGVARDRRNGIDIVQRLPDGTFRQYAADRASRQVRLRMQWPVAMLLAAIDPEQEARLVGLDRAVTAGRYLTGTDAAVRDPSGVFRNVPVLLANRPYLDERVSVRASRLDMAAVGPTAGVRYQTLQARMSAAPAGEARDMGSVAVGQAYAAALGGPNPPGNSTGGSLSAVLEPLVRAGAPSYGSSGGALRPGAVESTEDVWYAEHFRGLALPWFARDTGFRPVTKAPPLSFPLASPRQAWPVGVYDAAKLPGFDALTRVPLETYQAPQATGADAASRTLLGDRPLLPDSNPAGYLATPPLMLTNLANVGEVTSAAARPVSAVRVRVAGITGFDKVNRERVRVVAERIARTTGLDVDITIGSSLAPQAVELPAGRYGRPQLRLDELWSKKGVAAAIIRAVDRKSLVLFVLILVVCVLFLGNAVSAAVRDRRRELAVLACLGWPARRVAAAILGEVALIGVSAGLAGAALAVPLGHLAHTAVTPAHALLAVPIAVGLALVAGAWPALRAARTHPLRAVQAVPAGRRGGRARGRSRHRRTLAGLAVANLVRTPGRSLLGAAALAVGVCALTLLVAVIWTFHGAVVGSVLGDAVAVQVRGVDAVAVAAMLVLAAVAVGDVLYLGIRERGAELAALGALGWSGGAFVRLVVAEGLGLGVCGAVAGALAGLGGAAWFAGGAPARLVGTAALAAATGLVLALAGAVLPASLLRRVPVTVLLAED